MRTAPDRPSLRAAPFVTSAIRRDNRGYRGRDAGGGAIVRDTPLTSPSTLFGRVTAASLMRSEFARGTIILAMARRPTIRRQNRKPQKRTLRLFRARFPN